MAIRGRGFSELLLDLLIDISGKSGCGFHAQNCSWTVHDVSLKPGVKAISTSGSMKPFLHVFPPVLAEHAYLSHHRDPEVSQKHESISQQKKSPQSWLSIRMELGELLCVADTDTLR
jgi:hypothetical protein